MMGKKVISVTRICVSLLWKSNARFVPCKRKKKKKTAKSAFVISVFFKKKTC